jgi:hypothetical protein
MLSTLAPALDAWRLMTGSAPAVRNEIVLLTRLTPSNSYAVWRSESVAAAGHVLPEVEHGFVVHALGTYSVRMPPSGLSRTSAALPAASIAASWTMATS